MATEIDDVLAVSHGEGHDRDIRRHVLLEAQPRLQRRLEGDDAVEVLGEMAAENSHVSAEVDGAIPCANVRHGGKALRLLVIFDGVTQLDEVVIAVRDIDIPN